jgi:hypothetical protein
MTMKVMTRVGRGSCILCEQPLPKRTWWDRFVGFTDQQHSPKGAEGDECWIRFNKRMGIEYPGPKPTQRMF